MIKAFLFAFAATLGFCILFHVPKRHIATASLIGALGWVVYYASAAYGNGSAFSCFIAACLVGLLGDICSRVFKEASTVYIIPGILPLVPGAGMYYTMLAIIEGNLEETAATGTETLMMAGAIAVGLLVMGAILRIIVSIKRRIFAFFAG